MRGKSPLILKPKDQDVPIHSETAACLRYLTAPLSQRIAIPLVERNLPPGVRYTEPALVVLAGMHTLRLDADRLEMIARHYDAEVAFVTWRRDAGVIVDVAVRVAEGFEAFRGLTPMEHFGQLWLAPERRRLWVAIGPCGLQLAGRAPTTDQTSIEAGKARALVTIAELIRDHADVVELPR